MLAAGYWPEGRTRAGQSLTPALIRPWNVRIYIDHTPRPTPNMSALSDEAKVFEPRNLANGRSSPRKL